MAEKGKSRRFQGRRLLFLFMALVLTLSFVANPVAREAQAKKVDIAEIKATVDTSNWQLLFVAMMESTGGTLLPEAQRLEKMGAGNYITKLRDEGTSGTISSSLELLRDISGPNNITTPTHIENDVPLTFPSVPGKYWTGQRYEGSSDRDLLEANHVVDEIGFPFNEAFLFALGQENYVPNGSSYESDTVSPETAKVLAYRDDVVGFLEAVATKGSWKNASFSAITDAEFQNQNSSKEGFLDATKDDYIKITTGTGSSSIFRWRAERTQEGGKDSNIKYVTWGILAAEAFCNVLIEDEDFVVTRDNIYSSVPTSFEKTLISLFSTLADWVRSALGMWGVDDLVFNSGMRGDPNVYSGGIFPVTWEPVIWALFFICELVAFVLLAIAIVTNVLRKLASTVNPVVRANLLVQAKDLFIVAAILGLLPMLIQVVVSASSAITQMMGDAMGSNTFQQRFRAISTSGGSLGGVLMQFFYLAMCISFNVFYMVRSYLVAILIIASPIFLVFFAISESKRQLAKLWMTELLANILIQPIHAVVLGTALLLPASARPIESLVLLYCVMPISNIIRSLFFGNAGSGTGATAQNGIRAGKSNMLSGLRSVGTLATMGAGAVGGAIGAGRAVNKFLHRNDEEKKQTKEEKSNEKNKAAAQQGPTLNNKASAGLGGANSANNTQGDGGTAVLPSVGPTGKEELADTISNGGIIPSTGMVDMTGRDKAFEEMNPGKERPTIEPKGLREQRILDSGAVNGELAAAGMHVPANGPLYGGASGRKPIYGGSLLDVPSVSTSESSARTGDMSMRADGGVAFRQSLGAAGLSHFETKKDGSVRFSTVDTGFRGLKPDGSLKIDKAAAANSAFTTKDVQNLSDMARIFEAGTPGEKAALRNAGYENVVAERSDGELTGRFGVETNENFATSAGYSMSSGGEGMVEFSSADATNTMPRTLDARDMIAPSAYERSVGGNVGYTAAGLALMSQTQETPMPMPSASLAPDEDGSMAIMHQPLNEMGVEFGPTDEHGHTPITYDAGILGRDSDGATVYTLESPMTLPDRERVAQIRDAFISGSDSDRAWLKSQGVERVADVGGGKVEITYNEQAKQSTNASFRADENFLNMDVVDKSKPIQTMVNINRPGSSESTVRSVGVYRTPQARVQQASVMQPQQPVNNPAPTSQQRGSRPKPRKRR